jgi:hypothetical protein
MIRNLLLSVIATLFLNNLLAQEKNIQERLEENFKKLYRVDLYSRFPTFPKFTDPDVNRDEKIFLEKCNLWIASHPEFNEFLNTFKPSSDKENAVLRSE